MSAAPLTCQELVELVTDYLEGSLSRTDRRRFKGHIRGCPHCTEYLEQIRETIEATGHLTEDALAPEARDELLRAFRDWKTARA
jgi:anti-sigma factor RsiW